jgi:hypothetical protein
LLGKDLRINNKTTAIAMQQIGKHASTTVGLLLETMFSSLSVQSGFKEENCGSQFSGEFRVVSPVKFCMEGCEDGT